jgi:hypothetical protein
MDDQHAAVAHLPDAVDAVAYRALQVYCRVWASDIYEVARGEPDGGSVVVPAAHLEVTQRVAVLGYAQVVGRDSAVTEKEIGALLEIGSRLVGVSQIQGLLEMFSDWGGEYGFGSVQQLVRAEPEGGLD